MVLLVKSIVFIIACNFLAYFALTKFTPYKKELKLFFIASTSFFTLFALAKFPLFGYIIIVALAAYFTKGMDPDKKVVFYLAVVLAVSNRDGFLLSIGVPLGTFNYLRILNLCILLPILLSHSNKIKNLNALDKATLFFIAWICLLMLRGESLTNNLRAALWFMVDYLVPYLAIRFFLKSYLLAFVALCFSMFTQSFVLIFEGLFTWKIYGSIDGLMGMGQSMYKFRHGFLRAPAAYGNPLIASLFGNFAFLAAYIIYKQPVFRESKPYNKLFVMGMLVVTVAGTFFTGSRAGMAGLFLIVFIYHGVNWASQKRRDPQKGILIVLVLALIFLVPAFKSEIKEEFGYRYKLFEVTMQVASDYMIAGRSTITTDRRLDVLIQGEGIIDLVNTYIYVFLYWGLPGLILFVYMLCSGYNGVYKNLRNREFEHRAMALFAASSLLVMMFNLLTTSPIGATYDRLWVVVAICANFIAFGRAQRLEQLRARRAADST